MIALNTVGRSMTFASKRSWLGMPGLAAMLLVTAGLAPAQGMRVQMENGDPPPEPVLVRCGDRSSVTNSKGYFFFPKVGVIPDASEQGNSNRAGSCQWQVSLPGYVPSVTQTGRGTVLIVMHSAYPAESNTFSATSGLAPEGARKAFEDGLDAVRDQDWTKAAKHFTEAVKLYDRYAEAYYQLGRAFRQLEKPDAARRALLNAVVSDPSYVYPYEDLYQLAFERDDMEDLFEQTETLLRMDPYEFPQAYYYNAVANLQLKHYEEGEERIRAAIENDPDQEQPMEYFVLGFLLMNEGKEAEALDAFSTFLTLQPEGDSADQARAAMEKLRKRVGQQKPPGSEAPGGTTQ